MRSLDWRELRAAVAILPFAALTLFCAGNAADARSPLAPRGPLVSSSVRSSSRPPAVLTSSSPITPVSSTWAATPTSPASTDWPSSELHAPAAAAQPATVGLHLPRFAAGLRELRAGARQAPVRIVWLGDSHTAADFLTGRVRARLQAAFGAGGPGFVRWGSPAHRHDAATLSRSGRFLVEPMPPARRSKHGDGLFGYYGLRVTPKGWPAMLSLQASPSSISARARFDILFESRGKSTLTFKLGSQVVTVRDGRIHGVPGNRIGAPPAQETQTCSRAPGSSIEHLELEGQGTDTLTLEIQTGRPRLHGVIVESEHPGVVLDTVGIDGARIATALAWDEESFVAELGARRPDLVVLAFGTNEAFDALRVSAYDQELSSLLGRVRRAAPDSDCLVLGPPDALDVEGSSVARVPEIASVYAQTAARLGCAFFSLQAAMGGPGSFAAWQRTEPRFAQADRLHLTKDGYRELGERFSAELLGALGF